MHSYQGKEKDSSAASPEAAQPGKKARVTPDVSRIPAWAHSLPYPPLLAPDKPAVVQNNASTQENIPSFSDNASHFGHDFSPIPVSSSHSPVLQTKLTVNQPGDRYEQEADRVSETVLRMPQPLAQGEPGGHTLNPVVQARISSEASITKAPPIVDEVLRSPGAPLDAQTRAFFEPRFGQEFGSVRIHTDSQAAQSARAIDALAYTAGSRIVFGAGQHSPGTRAGQQLLAHELAHVAHSPSEPAVHRKETGEEGEVIPAPGEVAVPEPGSMGALKLDYPWQYPEMRKRVYPFRDEALSNFLRIYAEIDIDAGDMPTEEVTAAEISEERSRLEADLKATTTARRSDRDNLELIAREERLKTDLKYLPKPTKDQLPTGAGKKWTAYRYSTKGSKGEDLAHDALLARILDRFDADPGFARYPKWLRYMVLHFSGMRYKSAHGSYAPPTDLLKRLKFEEITRTLGTAPETEIETLAASSREEIEKELTTAGKQRAGTLRALLARLTAVETAKKMAFPKKEDEARLAALEEMLGLERELELIEAKLGRTESERLPGEPDEPGGQINAPRLRLLDRQEAIEARLAELTEIIGAKRLKDVRKRIEAAETTRRKAVVEHEIERAQAALEALDDLEALMMLKEMRKGGAFPDWVWREIVGNTALRLEEPDTGWEKATPEEESAKGKKDPITRRWNAIMAAWKKDTTIWRAKHGKDLSLVVIRAVCNEITEMALHARGVKPDPGIGQKAKWYAKGEGGTSFFRPAKSSDLAPGTSLFFARWEDNPPKDAVQIIRSSLYPDLRTDTNETIHDGLKDSNGCTYHIGGDGLVSRDCPAGSTIDPSVSPPVRTQWLNWYHEAIVVEVDEKHGRVVTFETGPIGIRNTRPLKDVQYGVLDHWDVYAGFAPSTAEPKDIDRYLKDILPGR